MNNDNEEKLYTVEDVMNSGRNFDMYQVYTRKEIVQKMLEKLTWFNQE